MTALLWYRRDFRLADNPALRAASAHDRTVIPVYVHAPNEEGDWPPGAASRWWLHHSLTKFDAALREHGSRLIVRKVDAGGTQTALERLIKETGATAVHWNRLYEPATIARDTEIKATLKAAGIDAQSHNAALLREPVEIRNKQGAPFQVFTPFWKHLQTLGDPPEPLRAPAKITPPKTWPASTAIDDLKLLPKIKWDREFYDEWTPGEAGAKKRLETFLRSRVENYKEGRDHPAEESTSRLSPHLHFGELGPRQIWFAVKRLTAEIDPHSKRAAEAGHFLREVGWREFAHHLLYHYPHTPTEPLRAQYARFPWRDLRSAKKDLIAWQKGRTGYPLVDAGMRQLWRTGWMHNRVRMIVASFLIKHLLISWRHGAEWFWDTLVDADLANNTLGWQWTAGCGADAAPYFRIFNPITQGEKFDAAGEYIRRWVPELSELPVVHLFAPWEVSAEVLKKAGVRIGDDYPAPIVDHVEARAAALTALQTLKKVES